MAKSAVERGVFVNVWHVFEELINDGSVLCYAIDVQSIIDCGSDRRREK